MTRNRADSSNTHRSSLSSTDNRKRKLEDNGADLIHKMKRHEGDADSDHVSASQQSWISRITGEDSDLNRSLPSAAECFYTGESSNWSESTRLQIFVRMMSGGKTIVIQADKNDTVEKLYQRIESKTMIPAREQRVIYKGKQLQFDQSLSHYSIEQDASLHLVGRMQSTEYPVAWRTVDDIMYIVSGMYRGEHVYSATSINYKLDAFFARIPAENSDSIAKYLRIFSNSSLPAALVMLYASPLEANKSCAKSAIKHFLSSCIGLPRNQQKSCLPVMLEFCRLLRKQCPDDRLYVSCRNALGSMLGSVDNSRRSDDEVLILFTQEIFPFFVELADVLVKDLIQDSGPSPCDVHTFSSFWLWVCNSIKSQSTCEIPVALPLQNNVLSAELQTLYQLFIVFLSAMKTCMNKTMSGSCCHYLDILKILHLIAKVYEGGKEILAELLGDRKDSFCALVVKFTKRGDDIQWIYDYREATNFEARRHLAMMLFPDTKEDYDEMHEMLIDRSNLLAESYEYIAGASPEALRGGLFLEFKDEVATGPGVLREWFYLVCKELFNPEKSLFCRSTDDSRRFSPNPASKVDPMHLQFFKFTGRVIALAMMHKVQVGVLFNPVFFKQLAGREITLEDIKDTEKTIYSSYKYILEMDPAVLDSDGLGLTFELETEELGKRDTKVLCTGGKSKAVNSENRREYVGLLIEHRFATANLKQVTKFLDGFMDIFPNPEPSKPFFDMINLEDLDLMLRGGENPINVDDWRAHTEYNGFKESDRQIGWFWKILKKMTEEEQRSILFFWTSNRFVPVEGFRGYSSKLYIYRLYEANDRLPMSHTCFYRLSLPKYPTMTLMEQRLRLITQDHVSSSFGKW
ncbi:unnamed protein product [Cochlearia groenlandica]